MTLCWPTPSGRPPLAFAGGALFIVVLLVATSSVVEFSVSTLYSASGRVAEFFGRLITTPDWAYTPALLSALWETVAMALVATFIALLISIPMGILAARNASPHPVVYRISRDILSFMRALPDLVWALLFVSAVGLGPFPGVLALAFVTVGFMGKFFAEHIEVVGERAIEGIRATGASRIQVIRYAMIPQAMPDFVGSLMYILDHNVRAATVLGIVGAGGIGYDMIMALRLYNYDRLIMIIFGIFVLVALLDLLSGYIRGKILGGHRHAL
ncbi:MAG: phosphonate ABC transporter, permease protein PhnE [Marinobacter sp.]|nr:phosphonate ABC transporter, permease protein PhnE [Marinobacter sp.]